MSEDERRNPRYEWREEDQAKLMFALGHMTGQLARVIELLESLVARPAAGQGAREASPTPRDASEPPWPSAGST